VLEDLWLPGRHGPNGDFYKGLIQLAGAFVHLQKNRLGPAAALFVLARSNLQKYPAIHEGLALGGVLAMIEHWLRKSESADPATNPYTPAGAPLLHLQPPGSRH